MAEQIEGLVRVHEGALAALLRHSPSPTSAINGHVYCGCCGAAWPCFDYSHAKEVIRPTQPKTASAWTHPPMEWEEDKQSPVCPACGLTVWQAMKQRECKVAAG